MSSNPTGRFILGLPNGLPTVELMSAVVSFKIDLETKKLMEKYKDRINWPEELRKFVKQKVAMLEAEENFNRIFNELKKARWKMPRGFSVESVRENRDRS